MQPAMASPGWVLLIAWITSAVAQEVEEDMLHYDILEEPIPGTFIANIFADAGIGNKYESTVLEQLQFRFLAPPELGFTIERDTGILRASSSIDRDATCPQYDECMFRLDVVALIPDPLRFLEIIQVTVQVEDINDNAPVFPESYISHPVLESATTGRIVVISTASDPDSGDYGIQDYELITTSPKFVLEINEKLDGSSELELILTEELDREREDYYNMKVIAYDGGNPPLSGSIDVTITVMDTNDHDPIFDNSTYDVSVEENVPIYSSIVRVHASDGDTGLYGQVVYGFSASSKATNGYLFGINNMTGDIFVKDTLDYEHGHIYHLTVTAQDQGPDSLTADATVIIRVRDINDNAPQITVNTLAATGTDLAEIAEDAELGTFVAHINVADPDSGPNGEFNCSLSDSHFRLQQLYTREYQIITRAHMDRETMPSYNLALLCQDFAPINPQVAIKHIEVAVIDVNDNTPMFRQTSYMANLIENNPVGTFLTHLNATDQDAGRNAEIEYSIQEDLRDVFSIDPTTGIITTNTMLDHEQVYEFSVRVYATDKGTPRRNSTALLVVYIQDENDERPTFSQEAYSFGVPENYPSHTSVGIVHATDKDSPPNNQMEFLLLSNEDHTFSIDPFSGQISTRVSLDRERQPVYLLIVVATDKGTPPQSSSVSVSVYVDDENDHAPVILFPSSYNNTVQVSSHAAIGHIVTRIVAVDEDIGRNGNLTYWFSRGNERGWLRLDPLTGRLAVNRDLGSVDFEVYDIEILVQDQGEPHQNAFTNLNVIVNKSIPFSFHEEESLLGNNFTIVISVACVSGILAVILIVCIIFMLRQKDSNSKHPKYVNTMKVLSVQEANAKNEKELNNIKMDTLKDPVTTTITVDVDNGYVSRTHTLQTPITADNHDGLLTPNKEVRESPPSMTPAHALALRPAGGMDGASGRTTPQNDLQVHKMPQFRRGDPETDSASSADGSNADSGRGPSEEGDQSKSSNMDANHVGPPVAPKPCIPHINGDLQQRMAFRPSTGSMGRNVTFATSPPDVCGPARADLRADLRASDRRLNPALSPAQKTVAMAQRERRKHFPHAESPYASHNGSAGYPAPGYHTTPRGYPSAGLVDPRQPRTNNSYGTTRDYQRPPMKPSHSFTDPRNQYVVRLDDASEISDDVMV